MRGIVIAGTNSGCGKTTITLGIMAALKKKGLTVQPFKTGPDFIDTGLHRLITGRTSRNLDLWMCGRDYVADCFSRHSADADISVVEGVMGMYDGNISTADLAAALGLPVILVVDAHGMAESAGAVVKGFKEFRCMSYELREINSKFKTQNSKLLTHNSELSIAGVIFNRIASDRHYKRVRESVQDVPVLGYLPRDIDFNIPHRHLGLTVAEEAPISAEAIDKLADAVLGHIDIEAIIRNTEHRTQSTDRKKGKDNLVSGLWSLGSKVKIAVAYDRAFCFYYEDNLDLLRQAGAEIVTFSPLSDSRIPDGTDALYIGGGYPELYAEKLSANKPMLESVRKFSGAGGPVYAECGGLMYLTEGIYDFHNVLHLMCGIFPFKTMMKKGRASLGYREAVLKERAILGNKGTVIRGHEFHYSEIVKSAEAGKHECRGEVPSPLNCEKIYSVKNGEAQYIYDEGYRVRNTLGSYIHMHFGSSLTIANSFIGFAKSKSRWVSFPQAKRVGNLISDTQTSGTGKPE
ncbi:MAG: cobyrinate a,c-diamide synthase [Nitrospiraceae bacterium]|nr:MAG: cobyrinate a,c-diamide synthase [Nitrospiraceae bacterium]